MVGALASYALVIGASRTACCVVWSPPSSVLAQFGGGVMLAFAFIATIASNGIGTMLIKRLLTGYTVNPNWLSSLPSLGDHLLLLQIPLVIIIFLPAVDSIRSTVARGHANPSRGNTFQCLDARSRLILAPSFISAFLLAVRLRVLPHTRPPRPCSPQRSILVPLMIQGAMRNELDPNQQGFAQVLAFAMIIVVAIVMLLRPRRGKRAGRWLYDRNFRKLAAAAARRSCA